MTECMKVLFFLMHAINKVLNRVHVDMSVCVKDLSFFFFMGASILPESVRVWEDVCVQRLWSGSMLGCIPHGGRLAPGHTTAMQHSENTHTRRKHTYSIHMDTQSWRQSETEERHYSMRQESGLQSTIPASAYLVVSILETRPNQTRQVRSVKKHGVFDSAHVHSSLWLAFLLHFEILQPSVLTLWAC